MSQTDQSRLDGATIGVLLASQGSEDVEFAEPKSAVEDAGADVEVIGPEAGEAETVENDLEEGDTYEIDVAAADASADDYDALIVPGGTVGADRLRLEDEVVSLVREHVQSGDPAGVICHGPWLLVEADVVTDRTLTSFPSLQTDVENAGGDWVDEEVVTDDGVVTSRKPDDLDAFCETIVETFAEQATPQEQAA